MKTILLFILLATFVLGVSPIDIENFEDYTLTTEQNIYNSLDDETDTDGVAENIFGWLGGLTSGNMSGKFLMENPPSDEFNEIVFETSSVTGTPGSEAFIYDVYICETGDTDLNTSTGFEQCSDTEILISEDFPLSTVWKSTTSGNSIYLNGLYELDSAKMYIIHFVLDNQTVYAGGANAFYTFTADSNGVTNDHACRIIGNSTCTGFAVMNNLTLKRSEFGAGNLFAESGQKWSCNTGTFPSCLSTVGIGSGSAAWSLEQEVDNKYINLVTSGGDAAGYRWLSLKWDSEDVTPVDQTSDGRYTVQTRMRINSYTPLAGGTTLRNYWGGLIPQNYQFDLDSPTIMAGKLVESSTELHQRIRGRIEGVVTTPLNSSCDINDGDWHYVNAVYNMDTSNPYDTQLVNLTVDGSDCLSYIGAFTTSLPGSLIPIEHVLVQSSGAYDVDFDDIRIFDGAVFFPYELLVDDIIADCPISNCLFYDDFDDGTVLTWSGDTNATSVIDGVLYFDKDADDREIDNTINGHDYNQVVSIVEFKFNETTTPSEIDLNGGNDFYSYGFQAECRENDAQMSIFNVVITRDDAYTQSENRSIITLFLIEGLGATQQIGSIVVENGDELIVRTSYDYSQQKIGLNFYYNDDIITGFNPDVTFNKEFLQPCNEIGDIIVERRDVADLNGFVGIDRLYWYGIGDDVTSDDFIFTDQNETLRNESIIKTDLDEDLHNAALTLGFRSTGMKILFWLIVMVGIIFWLVSAINHESMTKYIIIMAGIILLTIGWYIKFIPTILFSFVLFIIAVLGALVFKSFFSGGGVTE